MSLKESLQQWAGKVSGELIPGAIEEVGRRREIIRERWDNLNRSLAERALPDSRRDNVSELSLRQKAMRAGQKAAGASSEKTVSESSRKPG